MSEVLPGGRLAEAFRRAVLLEAEGKLEAAEEQGLRILGIEPDHVHAMHLLGLVAARQGRLDEAASLVERALATAPQAALFLRSLAEIERRRWRHDRALALARQAVANEPGNRSAHVVEGAVLRDLLRLDEAIACQHRALALAPEHADAHFELAKSLLLQGRFAEGWEEHEWRFAISGATPFNPPTTRPQWDGKQLRGTLVLVGDQGYGDVIQFARYIPWAAARAGDIAVALSPELLPLVAAMYPDVRYPSVRLFSQWQDQPDHEAWCPLSGLPRLHGTRLETIPAPIPYLHAEPALAASWRTRLAALTPPGHRRIGIAWAGRPTHNNDLNRSASPALFAPLASRGEKIILVSLQKGPAAASCENFAAAAPLLNLATALNDFHDTVAVIAALDLVITVDTVIAHLAGAMGRPVWIALPHAPDWRWLIGRSDSPWYPTARLFRQPAPGRWEAVAEALGEALGGAFDQAPPA